MIEARYHDRVNVLQDLFATDAATPSHDLSPFDRAEWYALLAETGLTPLIAIASDLQATAALALIQDAGRITPLRNWYSFTWRQIAPDGADGDRLLLEIARQLKSRGHRITLEPVPDEDGSATRLAQCFAEAHWRVEVTACDVNHILHVGGRSFAQYWAERPGPLRTTLKRKARKVEVKVLTHFDGTLWDQYERIYASSWKPKEDHPEMLRQFAAEEGAAGRLRFLDQQSKGHVQDRQHPPPPEHHFHPTPRSLRPRPLAPARPAACLWRSTSPHRCLAKYAPPEPV